MMGVREFPTLILGPTAVESTTTTTNLELFLGQKPTKSCAHVFGKRGTFCFLGPTGWVCVCSLVESGNGTEKDK
jgi:hypothetical protein